MTEAQESDVFRAMLDGFGVCGLDVIAADSPDRARLTGRDMFLAAQSVLQERDTLLAQVATLQSDANSWQSGYDKGRHDGARHRQDEVKQLTARVEAMRALLTDARRYVDKAWPDGVHSYRENCISGDLLGRIDAALQAKR